ncbi:heterokaryon incompatibility protein-domain-containing protein [Exophiala viscosa]|uniref:Heterokaryon incompatibility protein-domain-containing protein n=1 Tax=Exophiala viscosa TaxID=2486360 RepID=A0AAN6E138_9EURO|nr:heterokaryon incompatibility protein-domain-containing protein [Exophiala viscosa]
MQHTKAGSCESLLPSSIYDSLEKDRTIRLLTLTSGSGDAAHACTLETVLLDDCPPYDALSYVWGNATEREPLLCSSKLCSGSRLMITQNLYSVLLQFSHDGRTDHLWVDAVCINQEDLGERSQQVSFMGDIYARARCTLVWLGPPSDYDYQACEVAEWLVNAARPFSEVEETSACLLLNLSAIGVGLVESGSLEKYDTDKTKLIQLGQLLTRPWFQRVWIIQEVAKAKEVKMLHGNRSISFRTFFMAIQILVDSGLGVFCGIDTDMHAAHRSAFDNVAWLAIIQQRIAMKRKDALFRLINVARSFESTDPRDKSYGLLGMASSSDTLKMEPNYSQAPYELFRDVAITDVIHHRQLRMLSSASYRDSCRSSYDLPS